MVVHIAFGGIYAQDFDGDDLERCFRLFNRNPDTELQILTATKYAMLIHPRDPYTGELDYFGEGKCRLVLHRLASNPLSDYESKPDGFFRRFDPGEDYETYIGLPMHYIEGSLDDTAWRILDDMREEELE